MSDLPATHAAWIQTAKGSYKDVIQLDEHRALPKPAEGEVLVKVKYVALNPFGYKSMNGPLSLQRKVPNVLENDLSGIVVDSNSTSLAAGDEVFGLITVDDAMKTGNGTLAQYAVVKETHLAKKPAKLSFETAAALPVVSLAAYGLLITKGGLKSGQRVLINGGATSVGRAAIGIAKKIGAVVVVSCSSASAEVCTSLGADEVIDYTKVKLPAHLSAMYSSAPFDIVLDLVGDALLFKQCEAFTVPTAKYFLIGISPPHGILAATAWGLSFARAALAPRFLGGVRRAFTLFIEEADKEALAKIGQWAVEGKIDVAIDSTHTFDKAGVLAAYDRIASQKVKGKVVIEIPQ